MADGTCRGTSFRPVSSCLTLFAHRKMLHERNTKMCYKPGTKTAACQPASPPGGMGQPDRLCSFYICYYIGFNLMCCLCEFCWILLGVSGLYIGISGGLFGPRDSAEASLWGFPGLECNCGQYKFLFRLP